MNARVTRECPLDLDIQGSTRPVFIGFHHIAAMENGTTVGAAYVDGEHDGNGYRAVKPDLRVKR